MMLAANTAVIAAVIIDLLTGLSRSRRHGHNATSRGYRRTVAKLGAYFATMAGMATLDTLWLGSALLLRATAGLTVPPLPLFTTIGALALCAIEVKSIIENTGTLSATHTLTQPHTIGFIKKLLRFLIKNIKDA